MWNTKQVMFSSKSKCFFVFFFNPLTEHILK